MALLIITPNRNASQWQRELSRIDSGIDIRIWPDTGAPEDIDFAFTWNHPAGELQKYPNLKCIASLGAGVDHILQDRDLPKNIAVTRVVDPLLTRSMTEYVVLTVLNRYRNFCAYHEKQQTGIWQPEPVIDSALFNIGIMGLGEMGKSVAIRLVEFGFHVLGWSRTPKQIPKVTSFYGDNQLASFLRRSNILICLLPLTPHTRDILNQNTFNSLPDDAYIINVARGEHLVEDDLLAAIDSGKLSGACLDVFRQEPLPKNHPFWRHAKIMVTPHIASITSPESVAGQIVENYKRVKKGEPLLHQIDLQRGY